MKRLFLDDVRMPQSVSHYCNSRLVKEYTSEQWEIVRNYKEFIQWILSNGLPDIVSFDHDLAHIHYEMGVESFTYKTENEEEKTGLDCAKFLIRWCEQYKKPLPEYYIHSMNPVGAESIKNVLEDFKKRITC